MFAGDQAIWLHPSGDGYRSPRDLGGVNGADILKAPVDQPYRVREYGARDLEGHLWCFHSPLD